MTETKYIDGGNPLRYFRLHRSKVVHMAFERTSFCKTPYPGAGSFGVVYEQRPGNRLGYRVCKDCQKRVFGND